YPVLVRPSYVLGGRGMEIVHGEEGLARFMETAVRVSKDHPVLVDRYLSHATEIDVDVVADGRDAYIGGIQEHIEEAGIHSGDAACVLPVQTLPESTLEEIRALTRKLCQALKIVGLMNLQLAVQGDVVYVLEANPRASRTVPYVSKAFGVSLAKVATTVYRISENQSPDALGLMRHGEIRLVINTPTNSSGARRDGYMMRRLAVDLNIPFIATVQAAEAAVQAIEESTAGDLDVAPLQ